MSDFLGYKGKRVIVSGCFSGMGEATAKYLLDLGAEVHGFDYKKCTLPLASFTEVDLRDPKSIEAGVAGITGKIDCLFNCAGLPGAGAFPAIETMKVNFVGTRHLTEQVIPRMGDKGSIVSISSTGGMGWSMRIPTHMELLQITDWDKTIAWCEAHPEEVSEGYAFSKEAVIMYTQYRAAQLIKQGIRINCSLPSPTQTPMMASFHEHSGKAVVDSAAEPLGRYSTPQEQAGPLVLINSDAAAIVTGVVLPVDGGFMGGVVTGQVDLAKMMAAAQSHTKAAS